MTIHRIPLIGNTLAKLPTTDLVLRRANFHENRQIKFDNHKEWGGSLSKEQYYEKCLAGNNVKVIHTTWTLVDKKDSQEILSSCDLYTEDSIYTLGCKDKILNNSLSNNGSNCTIKSMKSQSISNVYVNPKHRGKGYASTMIQLLRENIQSKQRLFCDTLSIKGGSGSNGSKQFFGVKQGWIKMNSTFFKVIGTNDIDGLNTNGSDIHAINNYNISSVVEKDYINTTNDLKRESIEYDNSTMIFTKLFKVENYHFHYVQSKLLCKYLNIKQPTAFGYYIDNDISSYIIWGHDFSLNKLYILKFYALNMNHFKILIEKARQESANYKLDLIMNWSDSCSGYRAEYLASLLIEESDFIPTVSPFSPASSSDSTISKFKWININLA
ncbi:hypothetical protein CYY_000423 [Polysphondylium violaceum]|uniref:LYC1 C-terminal domain-containing protein n=1 Tax=Polysphondylium violaceum TaxID=133409 RepID=A0A8J4Q1H8_9MYCE|nr:hypothetical protein CYY_000423 [Polysphondylium violaceum]